MAAKEIAYKGDIYLVLGGSKDRGSVFQAVARNVSFGVWESAQGSSYRLDQEPSRFGYYDIIEEDFRHSDTSKTSDDQGIAGVLVPRRIKKQIVADDLRKRFGPDSALFREKAPTD